MMERCPLGSQPGGQRAAAATHPSGQLLTGHACAAPPLAPPWSAWLAERGWRGRSVKQVKPSQSRHTCLGTVPRSHRLRCGRRQPSKHNLPRRNSVLLWIALRWQAALGGRRHLVVQNSYATVDRTRSAMSDVLSTSVDSGRSESGATETEGLQRCLWPPRTHRGPTAAQSRCHARSVAERKIRRRNSGGLLELKGSLSPWLSVSVD